MNKVTKPAALAVDRPASKEQLRVVIVGHVDHGKSTLVGRLFHETGMLPEGKFEAIEEMCRRRGMPFEWAFLMDSLKAERDQGVTSTPRRSGSRPTSGPTRSSTRRDTRSSSRT